MTYEEYKKFLILEEKRINLNHYVNSLKGRKDKKRIGKVLSYYNNVINVLNVFFNDMSREDGISYTERFLKERYIGNEYKNSGEFNFIKITGVYKMSTNVINNTDYNKNKIQFLAKTIKLDPYQLTFQISEEEIVSFNKRKKGIVDTNTWKTVKTGTYDKVLNLAHPYSNSVKRKLDKAFSLESEINSLSIRVSDLKSDCRETFKEYYTDFI